MRRSASASISSTGLGTNLRPRQRSRARRQQPRQQRSTGAAGHAHADAREDGTNEIEATVDVPGDEELFGAASLELDPVRVIGASRCAEVGVGGLDRSAGIGERVGKSFSPRLGGG